MSEGVDLSAGVWVAYESGFDGIAVFPDELCARRHAMDMADEIGILWHVKFVKFGEQVR